MKIGHLFPETMKVPMRKFRDYLGWTITSRDEKRRDIKQGLDVDPGNDAVIQHGLAWIGLAQDKSRSRDDGVARHYSLQTGWGASYPETTGYIIPTLLDHARRRKDPHLKERARRMLDWLVSIQLPEGAFQGSTIGTPEVIPTTFDTGQILIGLAAGVREFGDVYRPAMRRTADWLVRTQDADGCWRNPNAFVEVSDDRVYETHVAWGLLEAAREDKEMPYAIYALRNINWALTHQHSNGWFAHCCIDMPDKPLSHTIGYVLRGIVEGFLFSRDARLLDAAVRTATGLLQAVSPEGHMSGRLRSDWSAAAPWVCLTGSVQIALCWLLLYRETGEIKFRDAAVAVNSFVRRTVRTQGSPEIVGGVKGSFPVSGDYARFEYLNWACKFMIDSCTLEQDIRATDS
jgi:squalene-hopene cyclase-like protein